MIAELTRRDEFLATVRRTGSGRVPGRVLLVSSLYEEDPEFFEDVKARCPHVTFWGGRGDPAGLQPRTEVDNWGILWSFPGMHLSGVAVEHPLADWDALESWAPPDPDKFTDWAKARADVARARTAGEVAWGGTDHGFIYLRMTYLRGFDNFMLDLAGGDPRLFRLRDTVADYWVEVARRWIDAGVDAIGFGDDLGHQDTLPISPAAWRSFFKPAFKRVFGVCREAGVEVSLHTDGYILPIVDDLLECGVTILNPQDLVNGLDNLEARLKGRACIDLDIDRQKLTVFGTPEEVDAHVRSCIATLGSPGGGLMLIYGAYPGTPKANAAAVALAIEKYHDMWIGG